jgi:hypothetical protein
MNCPVQIPIRLLFLCAAMVAPALGGEPANGALPPSAPKAQYSLLNPTPEDQLRDMDTDRPNVTNTPHTVDAGHWQLEVGAIDYAYFRDNSPGQDLRSDNFAFGQLNLRVGILENLEINLEVSPYETSRSQDFSSQTTSGANGFGDTILGGKLNLWGAKPDDSTGYTALAVQPQFKFPTGGAELGNGRFEFSVAVPFLVNLPNGFHLGLQGAVSRDRNSSNTGYVTGFPGSVSVDRTLIGNLDVYLEFACAPSSERHLTTPQTLDLGGTYPLGKNMVLDAGINIGLNGASPNIEVLAGFSIRR